ncbi:MAG: hypothetical protein HQM16_08195 [Deltaproteobacteria bacterium]|nr:hypothetical protein [Deltaproteobacteria bacterium]
MFKHIGQTLPPTTPTAIPATAPTPAKTQTDTYVYQAASQDLILKPGQRPASQLFDPACFKKLANAKITSPARHGPDDLVSLVADQCGVSRSLLSSRMSRIDAQIRHYLRRIEFRKSHGEEVDETHWFVIKPSQVETVLTNALKTLSCVVKTLTDRQREMLTQMTRDAMASEQRFFEFVGLLTDLGDDSLNIEHLMHIATARCLLLETFGGLVKDVDLIEILTRIYRHLPLNGIGARAELQFIIDMAMAGRVIKSVPVNRFASKRCDFIVDGALYEIKFLFLNERRLFPGLLTKTIPHALQKATEQLLATVHAMKTGGKGTPLNIVLYLPSEFVQEFGRPVIEGARKLVDTTRFVCWVSGVDVDEPLVRIPMNSAVVKLRADLPQKTDGDIVLFDLMPPRTPEKDGRIRKYSALLATRLGTIKEMAPKALGRLTKIIGNTQQSFCGAAPLPQNETAALKFAQQLLYSIEFLEHVAPLVQGIASLSDQDALTVSQALEEGAFASEGEITQDPHIADSDILLHSVILWLRAHAGDIIKQVTTLRQRTEGITRLAAKFRIAIEKEDPPQFTQAVEQYALARALEKKEHWNAGSLAEIKACVTTFLKHASQRESVRTPMSELRTTITYSMERGRIDAAHTSLAREIVALIDTAYPQPVAEVTTEHPADDLVTRETEQQDDTASKRTPCPEETKIRRQLQALQARRVIAKKKPLVMDKLSGVVYPHYWTKDIDDEIKALKERLAEITAIEDQKFADRAANLNKLAHKRAERARLRQEEQILKRQAGRSLARSFSNHLISSSRFNAVRDKIRAVEEEIARLKAELGED